MLRAAGTTTLLLVLLIGCKTRSQSQLQITGGQINYDHPYVRALYNSVGQKFCSAVFVAPDKALSAAHCFNEQKTPVVITDDKIHFASRVELPKAFRDEDKLNRWQYDAAVIYFKEPVVKHIISVEPARAIANSTGFHTLGFGCNKMILRYMTPNSALERAYRSGLLTWISPESMMVTGEETLGEDEVNAYVVEGKRQIAGSNYDVMTCPGDSGGALIRDGKLLGITSRHNDNLRASFFTSLQHLYFKSLIADIFDDATQKRVDLHVINAPENAGQTHSEALTNTVKKAREDMRFIAENAATIEEELANVYQKTDLAAQQDKVFEKMEKVYPGIISAIGKLAQKYTESDPRVFPILTSPLQETMDPYAVTTIILKLYVDSSEHFGAPVQLPWVKHFYMESLGQQEITSPQSNSARIAAYEATQNSYPVSEPNEGALITSNTGVEGDNQIVHKVQEYLKRKKINHTLIVPVFNFELLTGKATIIVVSSVEVKVITNGKVVESLNLYRAPN